MTERSESDTATTYQSSIEPERQRLSLVTGGSGFVGAHVVRALLERGDEVRCLVRPSSRLDNIEGLPVSPMIGDLSDPDSLREAVSGCDSVFHCAADYRLFAADPNELYATNVEGTRNTIEMAIEAGVERIVYTSSVGALGLEPDGESANERTAVSLDNMIGHYKRSKFLAERVVVDLARAGAPVIIVNPSTPVGELDIKPTPTGQTIVDFLNGRMPAYVDTGLNLVDVRDVAVGHLLAETKGEIGRRYILGNQNLTLKEILDILSRITGRPKVRLRIPHLVPWTFALFDTARARLRGKQPRVSLESVRMSRYRMFFTAERARRELGLPQSRVDLALERAVTWFLEHGYA